MDCRWTALINVLPHWMRGCFSQYQYSNLQEVRLRLGQPALLVLKDKRAQLQKTICKDDLDFCINAASRYSPWASQTVSNGFITIQGGHRIGICGTVTVHEGNILGIKDVSSLCIRVARQIPGIGIKAAGLQGNILILGRPGSGKSTLLRDIVRCKSNAGSSICVVDERQELFPCINGTSCFDCGSNTDVLSGCPKSNGIEIAIRVMSPDIIAVDEITAQNDCEALKNAGWCGINLLATAHASGKNDFIERPIYRPILESKLFQTLIILQEDKSWRTERITYGI